MPTSFAVAIFAYNEERGIEKTIQSVQANIVGRQDVDVYVLANGCTDRTCEIVSRLAAADPRVHLVEIELGDKCNAWNHYVHDIADDRPVHFFMDGDVQASKDAFEIMSQRLLDDDHATAVAGVPLSGRNRKKYVGHMQAWGWLYGNLYGVKGSHLGKLRQSGLRLPLGLRGNDHFITRFMHSDLEEPWNEDPRRVVFDESAGYVFESLKPYKPADVRIYYRRQVTYRWRQLQLERIAQIPLKELPPTMEDLDREILAHLRRNPPGWSDYFAGKVKRRLETLYSSHVTRLRS